MAVRIQTFQAFLALFGCLLASCRAPRPALEPAIAFTRLPPPAQGSPDKLYAIEGRATGVQPGHKIVLFAKSDVWWVQPTEANPYTNIQPDSTWQNVTHPGWAYAALVVDPKYRPPMTLKQLPKKGGYVFGVVTAEGVAARDTRKTIHFRGYDWEVRDSASDRSGTRNRFDRDNAWVDASGHLHLRIARKDREWASAEVALSRSLGYGSYRVVVEDISHLEPAAVFSTFTWDESGGPFREMDLEIARWGEPGNQNAQYVVQPYYVPANTVRFDAPAGRLTHVMKWSPGRVTFKTIRGTGSDGRVVDEHTFTSGIPSPGQESIHMNLYRFDNPPNQLRQPCEVVIEDFEYLP